MVHAVIKGCLAQVQHLGLGFHIMLGFVVALWKNNPVKIQVEMSLSGGAMDVSYTPSPSSLPWCK